MIKRTGIDYANDILESVNDIGDFIHGIGLKEFGHDKKTLYAILRSLEVMGEAAKKIPESVQKRYPQIPWKKMMATRDKLIHGYFGIEISMIWEVVKNDLPPLKPYLEKMVRALEKEESG